MGIPKLFRYISERYPCVTEKLKDYQIPEFDNLYIDANGIIHECSHPGNMDISICISEETIFKNIFRYIELLFCMIQPQKLFFVAIDGVAPRAKVNQQRSRRFKTAKDVEIQEAKARAKGINIPKENRFDSNCITPGTQFMSKLDEQLKYFITYKISTSKLWQKCKIIFSGSQVPGEGEHKIMEFIRYMKTQPNYNVNTKHCLYGLDADLIMLGLCTHELHFILLREEVTFSKSGRKVCFIPEETKFCLFHLHVLRGYIDHEFSSLKEKLPFPYDLEKIIDDWILMGFLVGNDFIPHLPNLHIVHGALSILYEVYMNTLPTLDGYINEAGTLRLDRFEKFMEKLSRFDILQFSEYYADLKFLETKTGKYFIKTAKQNDKTSRSSEETYSPQKIQDKEFNALLRTAAEMSLGRYDDEDGDDKSDSEMYTMEFVQHKKDYYINKIKYENIDEDFLHSQAECYVRAIQWNLNYYYNGCCSWSWYYPHHYAPYISDIKNFKDLKLEFELGQPFSPFEQLLAVLPPYSKELLPSAFQSLLIDKESPIIDYYPWDFKTDLNGKRQEWEAVVLIPFINEKVLLEAMAPHYSKLTPEEQARNQHGPMCLFLYTKQDLGIYKSPEYFPDIINHATMKLINREDIFVPREKLVRGLCPGVNLDIYHFGFSSLRYIKHTAKLEKAKVTVFQRQSDQKSMILYIKSQTKADLTTIGSKLLGETVFVNWPHLREAFVIGVSDCSTKLNLVNPQMKRLYDTVDETEWNVLKERITKMYKSYLGVDIGETKFLVYVRLLTGEKYTIGSNGKVHIEKHWDDVPSCYAYQTVVEDITICSNNVARYETVNDIFELGTTCFMLGHPYYGAMGKSAVCKISGRVKVSVFTTGEPSFKAIKQIQADLQTQYMNGNIASQKLGISTLLLSRITGTIFVKQSSNGSQQDEVTHNIGFNLKFTKKNAEVPGYTRKGEDGYWLYSPKALDLVRCYMLRYPTLFERLAQNPTTCIFQEEDLFTKGSGELNDIVAWLKEQFHGIESQTCGGKTVESFIVKKIEEEVDAYLKTPNSIRRVVDMQVQPYLLYTPSLYIRNLPPDPKTQTQLLDRICCTKDNFTVPLGYKGTVIGIQKAARVLDTMYTILFDKPIIDGFSINGSSECRAYRLAAFDFINISYGQRIEHSKGTMNLNTEPIEEWKNLMTNQEGQLRTNTSTFRPYRNENYLSIETPMSPKSRITQKSIEETSKNQPTHKFKQYSSQNTANIWKSNKTVKSVQLSQNTQKMPTTNPTSEFQAIWNELHKKQELNKAAPQVLMKPENSPQDPSAFLKAVLKIPDGNAQELVQPGVSKIPKCSNNLQKENKVLDTPPLVQQLFDQARQNNKTPIWYCSQLLNYYQLELNLGNLLPNMKILLPPLQYWYFNFQNNKWTQNIRPPVVPYYSSEPKPLQLSLEWVQKDNCAAGTQDTSKQSNQYKNHIQSETSQKPKSETKKCPTFVPLQAQKKSRHILAKQVANKDNVNQSAKDNFQHTIQKKKEFSTKTIKVEAVSPPVEKEKPVQNSSHQVQNTQTVIKPKKSRVAANFFISLQIEESNHSNSST
ncbi:5'-3' exoribonuclease 1 [Eufriesea mexicana]|uniref:5'-3' exoribonuclease 1 n=1 Tax=Eufriesea mexicana TaxID=516756 RepID=A0A310SG13_9HYME|nr:5'-3' exoribonuclease 1 [Eufriesea mexicana]